MARFVSGDLRASQTAGASLVFHPSLESQSMLRGGKIGIEKSACDLISEAAASRRRLAGRNFFRTMTVIRLIALSVSFAVLASCENMKSSGSNDPYASNYGNDGHYNPYPGQTGYAQKTAPSYQKPPMPQEPEPPADPYAFSASKKTAPSTSSSNPKKSVASSNSAKKKPTASKSTTKKTSSGSRYNVVKGDTLYGIAKKKGTTVAKIKAANGISGDLIRPGQSLKIP
jgi:LysM repeat protein